MNRLRFSALVLGTVALLVCPEMAAEQSVPPPDQQPILDELRQIRLLLEKSLAQRVVTPAPRPADQRVVLKSLAGEAIGRADAPLTMVEFTDLQCPYCRQFSEATFDRLKAEYIDTGKLRFITRDLPIERIHPMAVTAARASRCAKDEGMFWEMRRTILANNARLSPDSFAKFASDLGLAAAPFGRCLSDTSRFAAEIERDLSDAKSVGINGTPSFVLGRVEGPELRGILLAGFRTFAALDEVLKGQLAAIASKP